MRTILRTVLLLAVIAIVAVLLIGYWPTGWSLRDRTEPSPTIGTGGRIDTERAREIGADIGERAAVATREVRETVEEAGLTAKIKAKMALDDSVKARAIDVSTSGTTVTVSGKVPSEAVRQRALALTRETAGVTDVVDHLEVVPGS
jgi:hypothetical protein